MQHLERGMSALADSTTVTLPPATFRPLRPGIGQLSTVLRTRRDMLCSLAVLQSPTHLAKCPSSWCTSRLICGAYAVALTESTSTPGSGWQPRPTTLRKSGAVCKRC